jgi:hypothetical protein
MARAWHQKWHLWRWQGTPRPRRFVQFERVRGRGETAVRLRGYSTSISRDTAARALRVGRSGGRRSLDHGPDEHPAPFYFDGALRRGVKDSVEVLSDVLISGPDGPIQPMRDDKDEETSVALVANWAAHNNDVPQLGPPLGLLVVYKGIRPSKSGGLVPSLVTPPRPPSRPPLVVAAYAQPRI